MYGIIVSPYILFGILLGYFGYKIVQNNVIGLLTKMEKDNSNLTETYKTPYIHKDTGTEVIREYNPTYDYVMLSMFGLMIPYFILLMYPLKFIL